VHPVREAGGLRGAPRDKVQLPDVKREPLLKPWLQSHSDTSGFSNESVISRKVIFVGQDLES
jgi:hypothetical protein